MTLTPRQRAALSAGADYMAAHELRRTLHDRWMVGNEATRKDVEAISPGVALLELAAMDALAEALAPEAPVVAPVPVPAQKQGGKR